MQIVIVVLLSGWASGCGVDAKRDGVELNSLLATGVLNRIDLVNEAGTEERTVVLTNAADIKRILALFASTNRNPFQVRGKAADSGRILLFQDEKVVAGFPGYGSNIFSFRSYEFRLKAPGELGRFPK